MRDETVRVLTEMREEAQREYDDLPLSTQEERLAALTDALARLATLTAENERLRDVIAGHEAHARSVNEALNMGDGSYRP